MGAKAVYQNEKECHEDLITKFLDTPDILDCLYEFIHNGLVWLDISLFDKTMV